MPDGHQFTVPAAQALCRQLANTDFDVLFDHGDPAEAQTIVAWYGRSYTAPYRPKQLAHLDIAIVDPSTHYIVALIEIEDTSHNPKTLIGDLIAPQIASGIAIGKRGDYVVGTSTLLLAFAHFNSKKSQNTYRARIEHIQQQLSSFQAPASQVDMCIGRYRLDSFVEQQELNNKLWTYVQQAITSYGVQHIAT